MKLAYIIPIHIESELLKTRALASLAKQRVQPDLVVIVGKTGQLTAVPENYKLIESDETAYCSLVNTAVNTLNSEYPDIDWISILEYDDELTESSTAVFKRYQESDDSVDMWAGIAFIVGEDDQEKDVIVGSGNEAIWAPGISEEPGVFDYNMLIRANYVYLNGTFIRKSTFIEIGMLKTKMKTFFDYEFALRLVYQGKICRGIPKVTHLHFSSFARPTYISQIANLSQDERTFWIMTAKKEYFYESDAKRTLEYTKKG